MLRKTIFALPMVAVIGFFLTFSNACIGQVQEKESIEAKQTTPSPDKVVEVDEPPVPSNLRDIQMEMGYPKEAQEKKIEGTVVVKVLVNEAGEYVRHEILKEGDPVLAEAVEQHLSKLQFSPAKKNGEALKFWVSIPFKFKMG